MHLVRIRDHPEVSATSQGLNESIIQNWNGKEDRVPGPGEVLHFDPDADSVADGGVELRVGYETRLMLIHQAVDGDRLTQDLNLHARQSTHALAKIRWIKVEQDLPQVQKQGPVE